ncbi:PIG-L deacetylase family protein [Pseudalkalibacillus sp. A8]|uniref:PIG-L deacetylase family protein n=1 Tax=Pseudalkalibacillus sp. A8 TaxID=3382641 RepID=UPI0038B45476
MSRIFYYVPHQDDELLSFGVSVVHNLFLGKEVHIVLCTDGGSSKIKNELQMEDQEFITARNCEFKWSVGCLGVPRGQIHFRQQYKDGDLAIEDAKIIISEFATSYPNSSHYTFNYNDLHPDHANLGNALRILHQEKKIKDIRYYIKTNCFQKSVGIEEYPQKEYLPFLQAANHAYRAYIPKRGLNAIGYHSVPETFEQQLKNPRNKYHTV